eukprot:894329-Prorocentrum_lima.AAC.1
MAPPVAPSFGLMTPCCMVFNSHIVAMVISAVALGYQHPCPSQCSFFSGEARVLCMASRICWPLFFWSHGCHPR